MLTFFLSSWVSVFRFWLCFPNSSQKVAFPFGIEQLQLPTQIYYFLLFSKLYGGNTLKGGLSSVLQLQRFQFIAGWGGAEDDGSRACDRRLRSKWKYKEAGTRFLHVLCSFGWLSHVLAGALMPHSLTWSHSERWRQSLSTWALEALFTSKNWLLLSYYV